MNDSEKEPRSLNLYPLQPEGPSREFINLRVDYSYPNEDFADFIEGNRTVNLPVVRLFSPDSELRKNVALESLDIAQEHSEEIRSHLIDFSELSAEDLEIFMAISDKLGMQRLVLVLSNLDQLDEDERNKVWERLNQVYKQGGHNRLFVFDIESRYTPVKGFEVRRRSNLITPYSENDYFPGYDPEGAEEYTSRLLENMVHPSDSEEGVQKKELIGSKVLEALSVLRYFRGMQLNGFLSSEGVIDDPLIFSTARNLMDGSHVIWSREKRSYVVHPRVRSMLALHVLNQKGPESLASLHSRASSMFSDFIYEYPQACEDFLLEKLYHDALVSFLEGGDPEDTIEEWLGFVPEELNDERVQLLINLLSSDAEFSYIFEDDQVSYIVNRLQGKIGN